MPTLPLAEHHARCVARVPIFARLSPEQQDAVAAFARPLQLTAGQHLFDAGDRVRKLFVVHTGKIKVVRVSASGREHLGRVAGPGEVVGERAFLSGSRPDYRVEAMVDTRVCQFDHADLARLVSAQPLIAVEMLRSMTERLVESERRLALSGADVPARVADYLLGLPGEPGDGTLVRWPMPKKEVAAYLATTPESLSRALARLEREGLIAPDGDVVRLLDVAALQDRAAR